VCAALPISPLWKLRSLNQRGLGRSARAVVGPEATRCKGPAVLSHPLPSLFWPARTWYKPLDMSALENMAQGRVLWIEAKTHDNVSVSIVNVHQATAKRHDLQIPKT